MSNLYGTSTIASIDEMAGNEELMSLYLLDDIMQESVDAINEFCDSEEGKVIMEKVGLDKKIIDRATIRKMDLNRRIKLTAYQLARDAKSSDWAKLVKYSALKKQYATKILNKFGKKAERIAKINQKGYIKKSRGASSAEEK